MSALPTPGPTNYLEQFDAAAEADKFPLVRRWIDNEPLPFFKELREKRPTLVTPLGTLVTLYDEVIEVLNMPKVFTAALYLPKMAGGVDSPGQYLKRFRVMNEGDETRRALFGVYIQAEVNG